MRHLRTLRTKIIVNYIFPRINANRKIKVLSAKHAKNAKKNQGSSEQVWTQDVSSRFIYGLPEYSCFGT